MVSKDELEIAFTDRWTEQERQAYLEEVKKRHLEGTFFLRAFAPSPFHWHFQQAYEALQRELFLPGLSGLLNGIEASIRTTSCELRGDPLGGDLGPVMSNRLLREARALGMNVRVLAFPEEADFVDRLASNRREDAVRLVRVRNDVCHGNFQAYRGRHPKIGTFFTPECLGPISAALLEISFGWARELSSFLHRHELRRQNADDLISPQNPLAHLL
jgi:hypothetical protein